MSYLEMQRQKAIQNRDRIFRDPGGGIYRSKPREFVLQNPCLNLWAGIREDALKYFEKHLIPWWMGGKENLPSGHLLSSQIACINHLYFLRQRPDAATAVLQGISDKFESAELVDDGLVAFEVVGDKNYLGERSHTRGANATSIDAVDLPPKN